jgi:excinuclease ABC subunit C
MDNAVSHLDFERAAKYRDQITAIQQAIHQQNVENPMAEDEDIIGIAFQENQACVVLMMVRNGSLVDREPHFLSNVLPDLMTESLTAFIQQYYAEATLVPKTIVLPTEIEMADTIQDWLTERRHELTDGKSTAKVQLQTPQRGRKRQLLDLARQNARLAIEKKDATHLADKADLPDDRSLLSDLQDLLNLPEVPKRIEGFDISNLGEQLPVASMVVAIDGKPKYSEYRRFRIKTVAGQNDFAMMKEVIERRFQRSVKENLFPDLVLVDGGKGQLNAACQALEQLGLSYLPIIGLAKQQEHIFIPNRSEPIVLRHDNPTLHLIQRLRNEAHRLAINYHRKLRRLALKQSILDQIPLVGEKRKQALLLHFGSMDKIREASVTNLLDVAQIDLKVAENIYHYFRDQDVKYQ